MTEEGDFSFVKDIGLRQDLEDAWDSVRDAEAAGFEAWKFFREESPPHEMGYMFWPNSTLQEVQKRMHSGHSGSSMAMTLRGIEYIAKYGWAAFVCDWSKKQS